MIGLPVGEGEKQVAAIDTSVSVLEQALAKKDCKAMPERAEQAANAMTRLSVGPALNSLVKSNEPPTVEELREQLKAASESFQEVQQAIRAEDAGRLETALEKFRKSYGPVREAARRPAR